MVKEYIDIIYAKNMRPQCWGEPHSGYTYYKWENFLPNIHSMRAPKKTHNSWKRFLNPKLYRYFMDKNEHPQINTE